MINKNLIEQYKGGTLTWMSGGRQLSIAIIDNMWLSNIIKDLSRPRMRGHSAEEDKTTWLYIMKLEMNKRNSLRRTDQENRERILSGETCPYCNGIPELVDSSVIYGKSYGPIWYCEPCDAYCGCAPGTNKSLGRLADAPLRAAKKNAHHYFDMIWKSDGGKQQMMTRTEAYAWLSSEMKVKGQHAHIGMFDLDQCKKAAELSRSLLESKGRLQEPKLNF